MKSLERIITIQHPEHAELVEVAKDAADSSPHLSSFDKLRKLKVLGCNKSELLI